LSDLKETQFFPQLFDEYLNIKFQDISPGGNSVAAMGNTDTTEQTLQQCNLANTPKILLCFLVSFTDIA